MQNDAQNKEFRLRNSRAERGRFSDKLLLCASAHPAVEKEWMTKLVGLN